MADLTLDWDWENPRAARGDELRATWARLTIRVGDAIVTRVEDVDARGIRDGIYLPLYPVAEWVVANWWPLLNEFETPARSETGAYRRRHSLQTAAEGFVLPALDFAAEFLAPAAEIRTLIAGSTVTDDDVEAVAGHFHVSPLTIRYQIENHQIARLAAAATY